MRSVSSLLVLSSLVSLLPIVSAQLALFAKLAGKEYFGTATDLPSINDKPYIKQLGNTQDFNVITPSNQLKWFATEPERGVFNFTGAETVVRLAEKNGQRIRGHTCLWHSQLAPWVEAGKFDKKTLVKISEDHCFKIVNRFKAVRQGFYDDGVAKTDFLSLTVHWDVANEIFNEDGTFRETVFYNTTGLDALKAALKAARRADPHAKLYINDYNIDGVNAKSAAMIKLVKQLKKERIPIDGIGVQGHLILGQLPTDIRENLQAFADVGVDVAITELDIRMDLPVTPAKLEQQRKDYQYVVASCKAVKRCVGVTIWDWTDKYSWVPEVFAGEGAALPWDENLKKKPAYHGIADGFVKRR